MSTQYSQWDLGACGCAGSTPCPAGQDFCVSCGCTDQLTRTLTFVGFGAPTVLTLAWVSACVWSATPAPGFTYTLRQPFPSLGPVLDVPFAVFGTSQFNSFNSTITVVCVPLNIDFNYGPGNHIVITP